MQMETQNRTITMAMDKAMSGYVVMCTVGV